MQPAMNPIGAVASSLSNLTGAGGLPGSLSKSTQGAAPAPFSDLMTDAIGQVSQLEDQAHATVAGLMTGSGVDVHQAMIATEEASLSFTFLSEVRNKVVDAYQQVMQMQV